MTSYVLRVCLDHSRTVHAARWARDDHEVYVRSACGRIWHRLDCFFQPTNVTVDCEQCARVLARRKRP